MSFLLLPEHFPRDTADTCVLGSERAISELNGGHQDAPWQGHTEAAEVFMPGAQ